MNRARASVAWLALGVLALGVLRPASASASIQLELQIDPPNPQVGELIHVRYGLRFENESPVEVQALDFGQLEVLTDPSPPQMPMMFGGFGGGGGMAFSMTTAEEYLVRARAPGRYRIGNARVLRNGRVVAQRPPLEFVVGGAGAGVVEEDAGVVAPENAPAAPPPDPDAPPTGDLSGAEYNPNGFLRVAVDNANPYLGQQITLRVWLYLSTSEAACDIAREPELVGFWNESLTPVTRECASRWFTQNLNGRYMAVGLVRKIALFPSQTGRLTIGSAVANVQAVTGGMFRSVSRFEAHSPSLEITVREPPAQDRPADYVPGTVGPVTLEATVDRTDLAVGETATITVRASSPGSLASANVVFPANIDGLRIRTGGNRAVHDTSTGEVVSRMESELLLVPERAGRFELGQVTLPYWDPTTQHYGVAQATVPALVVQGSALPSEASTHPTDPQTELRPLILSPTLQAHPAVWARGRIGAFAIGFPPVAFALGALGTLATRSMRRRRAERAADRKDDPLAIVADARNALARDPKQAVSLAGRALDKMLLRIRQELPEGATLPADAKRALDEARAASEAARFAGADANAAELVSLVERAVRAADGAL